MSEVLFFKTSIRFSEAGLRVLPVRLRPGRRPPAVGQDRYRFSRQAQALLFMSLASTDLACVLVASFAANAGSLGHMSATLAVMVFVVACRAGWGRPVATSRQLASAAARDVAFALAALVVSPLASSLVEGSPRTSLIQSVMTGGLVLIAGRVCLLALSARRAEWLIERVVVLGREHEVSRWARSPCIDGLRVACAGAVLVGDGPCQMAVIDRIAPGSDGWAARILDDSGVRLLKRVDRFLLLQTDLTPAETDSALRWLEGVSQAVHLVEKAPRSQGDMPLRLSRLRPATVSSGNLAAKRMLDITLAGSALLLLLPALLLIGALIRLESRGPALFRQTRAGCNNLPFTVLKFRTMSASRGWAGSCARQALTSCRNCSTWSAGRCRWSDHGLIRLP